MHKKKYEKIIEICENSRYYISNSFVLCAKIAFLLSNNTIFYNTLVLISMKRWELQKLDLYLISLLIGAQRLGYIFGSLDPRGELSPTSRNSVTFVLWQHGSNTFRCLQSLVASAPIPVAPYLPKGPHIPQHQIRSSTSYSQSHESLHDIVHIDRFTRPLDISTWHNQHSRRLSRANQLPYQAHRRRAWHGTWQAIWLTAATAKSSRDAKAGTATKAKARANGQCGGISGEHCGEVYTRQQQPQQHGHILHDSAPSHQTILRRRSPSPCQQCLISRPPARSPARLSVRVHPPCNSCSHENMAFFHFFVGMLSRYAMASTA